jgi:hypothetical protein
MSTGIRQSEHIDGNFSTHIAIQLSESMCSTLGRLNEIASSALRNKTGDEPEVASSYHLSLSRHVFLRPHMIDLFIRRISSAFKNVEQVAIFLKPEMKMYLNDNKNTAFIAVPVDVDRSPVCIELIQKVDSVLEKFDLPVYYENPSPHVSLARTCRASGYEEFEPIETLLKFDESQSEELRIDVCTLSVFIGKQIYRIPFR